MKRRYFIYLSYKGTTYHGWQIQPNGISVQEVLAKALSLVLRTETEIVGAGRTDTGVHAALMVAHFDTELDLGNGAALCTKLNSMLPQDIAISRIVEVQADAHARFDAVSRRYEYHIITSKNVFLHGFAARFNENIDFEAMNKAAQILFEFSDFTSFSKLHTDARTNNCVIKHAEWTQRGAVWVFTIEADRFLRNMVRAVVGTLLEVGRGKMTLDEFRAVIEAKDRCKAGMSVPAQGLYLIDVQYPPEVFVSNK